MSFSTYTMYDKMTHQNINKSYALRMEVSKYGNPNWWGRGQKNKHRFLDRQNDSSTVDVADTSLQPGFYVESFI